MRGAIPGHAPRTPGRRGPLDEFGGAPVPIFAYSLLRLWARWTGPLLRVRRASDSDEADAVPDFSGYATLPSGFLDGTTGSVAVWHDQSGHGRHAVQEGTAPLPAWRPHGSPRGRGCVDFSVAASRLVADFGSTPQPISDFAVVATTSATGGGGVSRVHDSFSGTYVEIGLPSSTTVRAGSGGYLDVTTSAHTSGEWFAVGALFSGAASRIEAKGATATGGAGGFSRTGIRLSSAVTTPTSGARHLGLVHLSWPAAFGAERTAALREIFGRWFAREVR